MTILLHIETTTLQCGVAISRDGEVIGSQELREDGYSHAEKLLPFIDAVFNSIDSSRSDLDGVCVSGGPGSYTGLRIGVSTAKGICHALDVPLISIDTLSVLGLQGMEECPGKDAYIPMLDARRMEVYTRIITQEKSTTEENIIGSVSEIEALVVDGETYLKFSSFTKICFIGDGAIKCKELLGGSGREFIEAYPSVTFGVKLGYDTYKAGKFEDLASYEPNYLKAFIAGVTKDPLGLRK